MSCALSKGFLCNLVTALVSDVKVGQLSSHNIVSELLGGFFWWRGNLCQSADTSIANSWFPLTETRFHADISK